VPVSYLNKLLQVLFKQATIIHADTYSIWTFEAGDLRIAIKMGIAEAFNIPLKRLDYWCSHKMSFCRTER
jgi:hypothetical protein